MRTINCLIALLLAQLCFGQQVVRKVKHSPGGLREVYHVLYSDQLTLHGRYQRFEESARIEGSYKNGLQDGIWTEFSTGRKKFIRVQGPYKDGMRNGIWTVYSSRKKLKSKGPYQNDQRTGFWRFYNERGELSEEGNYANDLRGGKWSFYDDKGELVQEFDYTTRHVVSDVTLATLKKQQYRVINGADTQLTLLQRPPLFLGGRAKLNKPRIIQYKMEVDSVKVEVRFIIDKQGKARNFHLTKETGFFFAQEAMYTLQQLPQTWLPALLDDQPVEIEHSVTVLFRKVILKNEPLRYYREFLPAHVQDIGPQTGRYPSPVSSGLSPHACSVQIL